MRFFGLKTCDTCRKARKAIEATGQSVTVIDVRADGIAEADLDVILEQFGETAINRASTTWRSLSDFEKSSDSKALLIKHPTLLKRPVIEKDGVWTIGWKADTAARVIGQ